MPSVSISEEGFTFSYDVLSSYLPFGSYKLEYDMLLLITNDGIYKYVFEVKDNKLIFQMNESSSVDLIDKNMGVEIKDKAVFKLDE